MRRFLLLAHRVPVDGSFTLNDLAGGAGRMDEVARAVSTAFTLSNDLRRDTRVTLLFTAEPPPRARRIDLDGSKVRYLNPDERSTAALLKNALVRSARTNDRVDASPGLSVAPADPERDVREYCLLPHIFWLQEEGIPLAQWEPGVGEFAAVLSDSLDPSESEARWLRDAGIPRVSLGPRSMRASQCVDAVHREFDLREIAVGLPPDASGGALPRPARTNP